MKQPKKLTRRQKEIVANNNLNPENWALIKQTEFYLYIINKNTGTARHVDVYATRK